MITFVEKQVQRALNGRKPSRKILGAGHVKQPLGRCIFFPRVIRFSIAACVLTNAAAISSTLKPDRMWRTSATCVSSGSRGWQQVNIIRSRSSWRAVNRCTEQH